MAIRRCSAVIILLAAYGAPATAQDASLKAEAVVAVAPQETVPTDRAGYVALVRREAVSHGLPPEVAEAVAEIESGYEPNAVGGVGEIGLMQIRPSTAEMMGHDGGAPGLFDPSTNVRYSVRYLAEAWRLAGGDLCRALMKYRAGHASEFMSPLSARYCMRAKSYLARLGSPLADGVAPDAVAIRALPGEIAAAARPKRPGPYLGWRPGRHTAEDNARFWRAHEARIRALEAKIARRGRSRTAAR